MNRAEIMKSRWEDPGFRALMANRHRRTKLEIATLKAARQAKRDLRAQRAQERIDKRAARERARLERAQERQARREAQLLKQARKLARMNAPLPRLLQTGGDSTPSWKDLRHCTVTVLENGKFVRRSWADLADCQGWSELGS